MTFVMFVTWVVVAVCTGGIASATRRNPDQGMTGDILLALLGSGLACGGVAAMDLVPDFGIVATAVIAFVGSGIAIGIRRTVGDAAA